MTATRSAATVAARLPGGAALDLSTARQAVRCSRLLWRRRVAGNARRGLRRRQPSSGRRLLWSLYRRSRATAARPLAGHAPRLGYAATASSILARPATTATRLRRRLLGRLCSRRAGLCLPQGREQHRRALHPESHRMFAATASGSLRELRRRQHPFRRRLLGDLPRRAGLDLPRRGQGVQAHRILRRQRREVSGLGEQCDDGNTAGGDGCSPQCTVEPNYVCPVPANLQVHRLCGDSKDYRQPSSATMATPLRVTAVARPASWKQAGPVPSSLCLQRQGLRGWHPRRHRTVRRRQHLAGDGCSRKLPGRVRLCLRT
jgi:cysteine-rich repeat protein